jgi:hypothetical protein
VKACPDTRRVLGGDFRRAVKACPDTRRVFGGDFQLAVRWRWLQHSYGTIEILPFQSNGAEDVPQGLKPALIQLTVLPAMNRRPTTRTSFSPGCESRALTLLAAPNEFFRSM